ncbi:hypothetical protein BRM3_10035 [Brachybacterium huguangmaarense]|uniref:ATP synthase protein I n=1 Tax=Brachybacterium huguangmaarense TaxID=1652028 RepID=A0ABY6FZE8_9MICO|nr:hypothetical protein [Brachybacterium huguangmaarense]UYG15971.1 hypothetical protein BRM3_10035 [Brachybacterium huguangmaarense]
MSSRIPESPRDGAEEDLGAVRAHSEQVAAANDRHLLRALRGAVLAGIVLDLLLLLAALLLGGDGALAGALIGSALALVITLPTLVSARVGVRQGPAAMAGIVLGAWLVKMIVLIVVLLAIQDVAGIARPWLGVALLIGAVAPAVIEAVMMTRTRPRLEVRDPGDPGGRR